MITNITGQLLRLTDDSATLGIEAFEYEVFVPEFTRRQLQGLPGQSVSLHTIYSLDGDPARGRVTPRLVGFFTEIEKTPPACKAVAGTSPSSAEELP